MSEWLTTGEMIDRLHVGQTAEGFIETERGPIKRIEVTKNDAHSIMVIDSWTVFEATGINLSYKWRILPKYVRFEEAMRALAEGKTVWAWVDGEKRLCYWIDQESGKLWGMSAEGGMTTVHNIGFFKEWTIEE